MFNKLLNFIHGCKLYEGWIHLSNHGCEQVKLMSKFILNLVKYLSCVKDYIKLAAWNITILV